LIGKLNKNTVFTLGLKLNKFKVCLTERTFRVTERRLPVTVRTFRVTGRTLRVTERRLRATERRLPVTERRLPVTERTFRATERRLPVTPTNAFKWIIAIAILFISFSSFSQTKTFPLNIQLVDTLHKDDFNKIKKQLTSEKLFRDSFVLKKELQQIILKLNNSGYLTASFDEIGFDSTSFTAKLFLGNRYQWASLAKGNVDEGFISGTGFRLKLYQGKAFRYEQVRKLQENILVNCENNGYPFASIKLDSITVEEDSIKAKLNLDKGRLIKLDSVELRDSGVIAPVYIYNYIGIKPGDIYNEALAKRISNRIRELAFLSERKPYEVIFEEKETHLLLYLEGKKASQFDGVIGVLPDNDNPGKVNLTGEVHLKLQNSLQRGEVIELNWKTIPVKTQDLKVHALYPFVLNTPIGLDGNLAIYKKDTTYIDVDKNIGVQYLFAGNNYVKVFVGNKESSLISTKGLESITVLPPYADVSLTSYGLGGHYEKLDYRLNPRKGFMLEANVSVGNRVINKSNAIPVHLYDSVKLKTTQYRADFSGDYFIPLGQRQVIDVGNKSGYLYGSDIFTNELYRIGGLRSLRGFDEESIYASQYSIGKLEFRYLLEQNSFLFIFANGAWYQNKSRNKNLHDTPYGFGTGINFETKLGIMSISYALGKEFSNPIYFRNAKVHFGIVNYF
jgi:outer membrane protein assembly factor BamA